MDVSNHLFLCILSSKTQQNSENGVSAIDLNIERDIGLEKPNEGDICRLSMLKSCIISFTASQDVRILFRVVECLIRKKVKRE